MLSLDYCIEIAAHFCTSVTMKFLQALHNTFFVNIALVKVLYIQYFKFDLKINNLHHQKAYKKLYIINVNSQLDFWSTFQAIDPLN